MITVSKLAKTCGVSRTTILYYEKEGLLAPTIRAANGYRWYDDEATEMLKAISRYRSYGISVSEIATLLEQGCAESQSEILKAQFEKLENQIHELRRQQSAIVSLLQQPELLEKNMVTKERWVEIMRASGFSDEDMINWHKNFEQMEPAEHQLFLESLGIEEDEISKIRAL